MTSAVHDQRITLVGLFIEAHAGLVAELGKRLERDCDLSVQWFEVMLRLVRSPECRMRMSDLARESTVTLSGLTRVVDRLEEAGYVIREACPTDRRVSWATLTPAGRRKIESAVPKHVDHVEECFTSLLTKKERADLEHILRKLRDGLPEAGRCP